MSPLRHAKCPLRCPQLRRPSLRPSLSLLRCPPLRLPLRLPRRRPLAPSRRLRSRLDLFDVWFCWRGVDFHFSRRCFALNAAFPFSSSGSNTT